MNEKDWTFLTTIYNEANLTHAAEKLYISQPALTYRIRELEKELNIKIFIKGKGSVKFTKEGVLLVEYAKSMLIELSKLKDQLYEMTQPGTGLLKISAGENFARTELPEILSKFHQLHPNIQFSISSINLNHILDSLVHAESHLAIIGSDMDWNDSKLLLKTYPIYLAAKEAIAFTDLPKLPRIIFNTSASTKKLNDDLWQEYFSVPPTISMKVNKLETCAEMIKQGFGYAFIPINATLMKDLQQDLYMTPLYHKDGTPHQINCFAYYRKEVMNITAVKTFINFLKQYFVLERSLSDRA